MNPDVFKTLLDLQIKSQNQIKELLKNQKNVNNDFSKLKEQHNRLVECISSNKSDEVLKIEQLKFQNTMLFLILFLFLGLLLFLWINL